MNESVPDGSVEWRAIEPYTLLLSGYNEVKGAPSIQFVIDDVLSEIATNRSVALGMDVTVTIPDQAKTGLMQIKRSLGFYGSIKSFRSELWGITQESSEEATLSGAEGLTLTLRSGGPGSGQVVVEGTLSTCSGEIWPWPKNPRKRKWLFHSSGFEYCLQFAFLSSLVDPGFVDTFIADIDRFLRLHPDC